MQWQVSLFSPVILEVLFVGKLPFSSPFLSSTAQKRSVLMHSFADPRCIQCHVNNRTLNAPNQNSRPALPFVGSAYTCPPSRRCTCRRGWPCRSSPSGRRRPPRCAGRRQSPRADPEVAGRRVSTAAVISRYSNHLRI